MEKISQYFDEFKKNFLPYLRENLICIIIITNSFAVLVGNIFVWIIKRNNIERALVYILEFFFNSMLVITSGIITATFRTINHIMIYFFVNVTLIVYIYFIYYYLERISSSLAFVGLHTILLILLIVSTWICREGKSLFVIINPNKEIDTKIRKIYMWYYLQLTLCHAQILAAMFSVDTYISIYRTDVNSPIDLWKCIPWPSILLCIIALIMIKGVRNESKNIMIVFYLISLTLCVYYTYNLIADSKVLTSQEKYVSGYILETTINLNLDVNSFFITIITMINSIICHKNFGKGLKDYILKDELKDFKESYKFKDDLDEYYKR
ncbi:uncharacterized protein OCT59_019364 [Rhizophagus irregularis]|uniref:uncharacterized protein n=1 Tax=Rhizophagus irregularis TaxID=588596 RepID=UPI0033328C01|nr:hypothetical protein OCT59_019364 [Rhizophagus irregularis]